jgi:hypothetical protein
MARTSSSSRSSSALTSAACANLLFGRPAIAFIFLPCCPIFAEPSLLHPIWPSVPAEARAVPPGERQQICRADAVILSVDRSRYWQLRYDLSQLDAQDRFESSRHYRELGPGVFQSQDKTTPRKHHRTDVRVANVFVLPTSRRHCRQSTTLRLVAQRHREKWQEASNVRSKQTR